MLKATFVSQQEYDSYIQDQQKRMENGYLTRSEREQLKSMLIKDYKPIIKSITPKISLVQSLELLKRPCQEVTKEDNIKEIIQQLKDALTSNSGLGISANQIGIQKKISYIKIPKFVDAKTHEWNYNEYIIINAKIIEYSNPIKIKNEGCLSFPGIGITTKRYVFCTVEYLNEKLEVQTGMFQDLESFVVQHEYAHQQSRTIFDDKWKAT
jgi:peptide deformylase